MLVFAYYLSLQEDVSSYLRSCGWYDEVHKSMRAKKRLLGELSGGDCEDGNDLKLVKPDLTHHVFSYLS